MTVAIQIELNEQNVDNGGRARVPRLPNIVSKHQCRPTVSNWPKRAVMKLGVHSSVQLIGILDKIGKESLTQQQSGQFWRAEVSLRSVMQPVLTKVMS